MRLATVGVLVLILATTTAAADRTQLLKVNLKTGRKVRIDRAGPKTAADRQLDAMLAAATGKSFSTADLERIERAVRRYLKATRPRSEPRLLLFLYPGRITKVRLAELREVLIDVDLVVDPCGRSHCTQSVAKHIEILGKSIQQAVIRTQDYVIRFKSVTITTKTHIGGGDHDVYRFAAGEVVRAAKSRGGHQLVRRVSRAKAGYGRAMAKMAARRIKLRRVRLGRTPTVTRRGQKVSVAVELKSDRVRYKRHVLAALAGAMEALRKNPLTPADVSIRVVAMVPMRGLKRKVFSCNGSPVLDYLDGKITTSTLWDSYVLEQRKGGRRMTFSDADTRSGSAVDSGPDRTPEILSSKISMLAPCLQAEAQRNRRFRGVTLLFSVDGSGRAKKIRAETRVSRGVLTCLKNALGRVTFQRHGGADRPVRYPLYIKR